MLSEGQHESIIQGRKPLFPGLLLYSRKTHQQHNAKNEYIIDYYCHDVGFGELGEKRMAKDFRAVNYF
jgi:hypothetical protein